MTSHVPAARRPTRPCTAELLAAVELPATTACPVAAAPKLPPFKSD